MRLTLKLLEQLPEIMFSDVSNDKYCLFLFLRILVLTSIEVVIPLPGIPMRGYFTIFQTINIRRYVQDNLLITIIDLPMFPNIVPSTHFHVHRCELLFP